MRKEDFEFIRKDVNNGHEDYWFKVVGDTKEKLRKSYYEYGIIEIAECVYSKDEEIVGIKRQYPFNFDVTISNDDKLKELLMSLADTLN